MRQGYIVILALQETGKLLLKTKVAQRPVNFFQIKLWENKTNNFHPYLLRTYLFIDHDEDLLKFLASKSIKHEHK